MSKENDTQLERHPGFIGQPFVPSVTVFPPPPSLPPMYGLAEPLGSKPEPTPWRACVSLGALARMGLSAGDVYAFSVHDGVLVCWDPDLDDRLLQWLAELPESVRVLLRAVHESKGMLSLTWRRGGTIPAAYAEKQQVSAPGDIWTILASVHEPEAVEKWASNADDFHWPDAHSLGVFDIEHATDADKKIHRAVWMGTYWVLPGGNGSCGTARLISHGYVGVRRTKAGSE